MMNIIYDEIQMKTTNKQANKRKRCYTNYIK